MSMTILTDVRSFLESGSWLSTRTQASEKLVDVVECGAGDVSICAHEKPKNYQVSDEALLAPQLLPGSGR
jgi:hypothetical protein